MAAPDLSAGITLIRFWVQDASASLPGVTDAQITLIINEKLITWYRVVEQRGARVSLGTYATGVLEQQTDAAATYPELLNVSLGNIDASTRDDTLEKMEWNELQQLQKDSPSQGIPTRYAAFKASGADQTWTIALHPIPAADYELIAIARTYPTPLSVGTDVPDVGDAESYWVYRLAAADLVNPLGAPELMDYLLGPIPENIRELMGVSRKRLDPKRRPEESVL